MEIKKKKKKKKRGVKEKKEKRTKRGTAGMIWRQFAEYHATRNFTHQHKMPKQLLT